VWGANEQGIPTALWWVDLGSGRADIGAPWPFRRRWSGI